MDSVKDAESNSKFNNLENLDTSNNVNVIGKSIQFDTSKLDGGV